MSDANRTMLLASLTSDARDRAVTALIRIRMFAAPGLMCFAATFAYFEPVAWRRWVLAGVVFGMLTLTVVEAIRHRRQGITPLTVPLNLFAMLLALSGLVTATGGLFSPLIPGFMIGTAVVGFVVGRPYVYIGVAFILLPAVWCFAIVHSTGEPIPSLLPVIYGASGAFERGPAPWVAATIYTFMILALSRVSLALRATIDVIFAERIEERDRALAIHAEQNSALTTLSAEIAHELKNPLTSVKGLAALLAKDTNGKSAERLSVLRTEVDRMQGVLEEFLNFSRPLVPLSVSEIDLVDVARDVVRLHEGSAGDRSVRLSVEGDRAPLRADERKVRQIVMNLVQNALEASPDGGDVAVRVNRVDDRIVLRVLDRGPGVDPDVDGRVFDAGVTTKAHGSGIGLSVARGLARQHGGELALEAREGGGCAAVLTLPEGA